VYLRTVSTTLTVLVAAVVAVTCVVPANAVDNPSGKIVAEVKAATASDPAEGGDLTLRAPGVFSAPIDEGSVEITTIAGRASAKAVAPGGSVVEVGLPLEVATDAGAVAESGAVTFRGVGKSADVAVETTDDGFRILTVIGSASESSMFTYPISAGVTIVIEKDGSVSLSREGVYTDPETGAKLSATSSAGTIAKPWAKDAAGRRVPTHYEVRGNSLVQFVDHTSQHFEYPVVADPEWSQSWLNTYIWWDKPETMTIADGGWSATGLAAVCAILGGPIAGAACLGLFGSIVYQAGVAKNSWPMQCVAIRYTTPIGGSVITYSNDHCHW
jgi:hypothetical protein